MEPIVLLGLICVCYGGYISLLDLWGDISALFPGLRFSAGGICRRRERCIQAPVKKMAGMNI